MKKIILTGEKPETLVMPAVPNLENFDLEKVQTISELKGILSGEHSKHLFPEDITTKEVREMRLEERMRKYFQD